MNQLQMIVHSMHFYIYVSFKTHQCTVYQAKLSGSRNRMCMLAPAILKSPGPLMLHRAAPVHVRATTSLMSLVCRHQACKLRHGHFQPVC